nr:MAG TPA: hypothetical protein [Caudoviricetes sp.]
MPKLRVERSTDYRLRAMIRGEMAAQSVSVATACRYADCCANTLYKIFDSPTAYMDKTLRLMRGLSIPIEKVREAITYPY